MFVVTEKYHVVTANSPAFSLVKMQFEKYGIF